MPSVTIGFPVYNAEEYIESALVSLTAQTHKDLIILISDNASTDKTPAIIKRWLKKDKRIVYHRQTTNIGPVANFQWVLHQAKTKWFLYGAHDDKWTPNYVSELYQNAIRNKGTQLSVGRCILTHPDGSDDRELLFIEPKKSITSSAKIRHLLRHANSGWFYGIYDRKALIDAFNECSEFRYTWAKDFLLLTPFIMNGTLCGTNKAAYYKRQTGLSSALYKPQGFKAQAGLYFGFMGKVFKYLFKTNLNWFVKISLIPTIINYTERRAWKLRRILKSLFTAGLKERY